MATYGNTSEPGIISSVNSAYNASTGGDAPSDVGIVGQADLADAGSTAANANETHEITRESQAADLFGSPDTSLLTNAVISKLREGAFPVYVTAAERSSVDSEDVSGSSGTLANTPVSEDTSDVTFTVDGTDFTTVKTYRDPSNQSPDTEEAYYNPVTGDYELSTGPSSSASVDYDTFDYDSAISALQSNAAEELDFVTTDSENEAVSQTVVDTVESMANEQNYAIALVGPGDTTIDPDTFTNSYDSSRVQVVFGTRFEDDTSMLAAYAGKRASLGLDRSPISVSLESDKRVADYQAEDLAQSDRESLISENVVPIADRSGGPLIKDDPTTVTPDNEDEQEFDLGYKRLLFDYVANTVEENEEPFIGRLNRPGVRDTFRDLIVEELKALQESGQVLSYDISVTQSAPTEALLELSVDAAEPIRFIRNNIWAGNR